MRFDLVFIVFGVLAGAALSLAGLHAPQIMHVVPALLWLLATILLFDIATAHIRGVPVMASVPTQTRLIAFCGGVLALMLSGGLW